MSKPPSIYSSLMVMALTVLANFGLRTERLWAQTKPDTSLSFFITSTGLGKGANLGGLSGADSHCQSLAEAVGAGRRTWRAYLSTQTSGSQNAVNARDRIGAGPWYNSKGLRIAMSVEDLHSLNNKLSKVNSLTEKGLVVNGRGDTPNQHDMLTGSKADGTAFPPESDQTCKNWTSETTGSAMLGHHDRHGVSSNIDSTSWNQAHASSGCSLTALIGTGGNGYFYCFAADATTGIRLHGSYKSPLEPNLEFVYSLQGRKLTAALTSQEAGYRRPLVP
jgi:hypothetical protein